MLRQECEEELTAKAAMVSRLHEKTAQIGNLLTNLQKHNAKATSPTNSFIPKIPPFKGTHPIAKTAPKDKNNFSFSNGVPKTKNNSTTNNSFLKNTSPPDKGSISLSLTDKNAVKDKIPSYESKTLESKDSAQDDEISEDKVKSRNSSPKNKQSSSPEGTKPDTNTSDH